MWLFFIIVRIWSHRPEDRPRKICNDSLRSGGNSNNTAVSDKSRWFSRRLFPVVLQTRLPVDDMAVLSVAGKMDVGKKAHEPNFDQRFSPSPNTTKKGKKWREFGERRADGKPWGHNNGYERQTSQRTSACSDFCQFNADRTVYFRRRHFVLGMGELAMVGWRLFLLYYTQYDRVRRSGSRNEVRFRGKSRKTYPMLILLDLWTCYNRHVFWLDAGGGTSQIQVVRSKTWSDRIQKVIPNLHEHVLEFYRY